LYNSENIVVPPVSFVDNQDLIDLIEKSSKQNPGLLVLLDEELNLIGAGSDANFLKKANNDNLLEEIL
jgi:myosin heavy subunit